MIIARRVDIRYATALLQTAKEQGLEQEIYRDMGELRTLFLSHSEFRSFLQNPSIKPSKKSEILQEIFKNAFHKLTQDFLELILRKSRIGNVQGIVLAFVQLYRKEHGLKIITVYTAEKFSEEQKSILQITLNKYFKEQTVELRYRLKPEMIGGLILRYDDYLYDNSISAKLEKFRREFESNVYEPQI